MRELQSYEINDISGGDLFSTIGAAVLGFVAFTPACMAKATILAGNTGGILGAGIIGGAFGVLIGGISGAIMGITYGLANDWDKTLEVFNNSMEQWADLTLNNPK
jgi:hypothetical protein